MMRKPLAKHTKRVGHLTTEDTLSDECSTQKKYEGIHNKNTILNSFHELSLLLSQHRLPIVFPKHPTYLGPCSGTALWGELKCLAFDIKGNLGEETM